MKEQIRKILDDTSLESEEVEDSKAELIENLITEENWQNIQNYLFEVLSDDNETYYNWHTCFEIFWGAVLDSRTIDGNRIIALAYYRLKPDEHSSESNLAWSLASELKGEDYFSEYNPLEDPDIIKIINEYQKV
ncbi:MAG: hypothetical protein P8179_12740 [Candidatus Thiodiazotropha sp.]|jgi:hypothetical protein